MDEMTKRLIKEAQRDSSKGDFFHSSGYARAQQGAHIGAAGSGQTFKERQKLAREFVGKYDDAKLNRDAMGHGPAAKAYAPETTKQQSYGAKRWQDMQAAKLQRAQNAGGTAPGVAGAGAAGAKR